MPTLNAVAETVGLDEERNEVEDFTLLLFCSVYRAPGGYFVNARRMNRVGLWVLLISSLIGSSSPLELLDPALPPSVARAHAAPHSARCAPTGIKCW